MTITDYKLIQGAIRAEFAADVALFLKMGEGWEAHGSPLVYSDPEMDCFVFFQAIIKREPEHAELDRLRDLESHVSQIVTELDAPCAGEAEMLTFAHEELTKALRGGRFERK